MRKIGRLCFSLLLAALLVACGEDNGWQPPDGGSPPVGAPDTAAAPDTVTVTDSVTDTVTASDTVTVTVTDSVTASDTVTDSDTVTVTVTDSVTASDTVTDSGSGSDAGADDDAGGDTDTTMSTSCPFPPTDLSPPLDVDEQGRYHRVAAFPFAGLRDRALTIYLPADYDSATERRYPVLYMHDGQNLFSADEAAFGVEWQVDEAVDALVADGAIEPVIVVGVWNTADRHEEYRSGPDPRADDGSLAALYREMLAEVIKPWVDARYRTRCGREDTALMGSSMGGVASLAHALRYPEVWGRIGCVSTAFWYGDKELPTWIAAHTPERLPDRVWMDVGTAEGGVEATGLSAYLVGSRTVRDRLRDLEMLVGRDLGYLEIVGGVHNEADWAARLPLILRFLYGADTFADLPREALQLDALVTTLLVGGTTNVSVALEHPDGIRQTLPNDLVTLGSEDEPIATIDAGGTVTALADGPARLTARYGLLATSVEIAVESPATTTFRVRVPANTPTEDTVHVVGNLPQLGSWDGVGLTLERLGPALWQGSVELPRDTTIRYKYTRGSWESVEKAADGSERDDRTTTGGVSMLDDEVLRWADL